MLVMIHGGALNTGAGDEHDGSLIVTTDHIIVVSVSCRLGPLGFLTIPGLGTTPATAEGNYGLLDQEAALRWVRRDHAKRQLLLPEPGRGARVRQPGRVP